MIEAAGGLVFNKDGHLLMIFRNGKWDLPKGKLETVEYNEYLRILENGYKIKAVHVESSAISVDTEEDLKFVRNAMITDPLFQQYSP